MTDTKHLAEIIQLHSNQLSILMSTIDSLMGVSKKHEERISQLETQLTKTLEILDGQPGHHDSLVNIFNSHGQRIENIKNLLVEAELAQRTEDADLSPDRVLN